MIHRRNRKQRNFKNKNWYISILSLVFILILSLIIANNLALAIYKGSNYVKVNHNGIKVEENLEKQDDKKDTNNLMDDSLILFQGGVFTDLENAEEFKEGINHKVLSSIVNDEKYERIIVGLSNKENFTKTVNMLRKNNVQFVKQIYKIPNNIKYNYEILDIIKLFSEFILNESKDLDKRSEFDVIELKKVIENINPNYGNVGSYKKFNELKDMILEFDSKVSRDELESVFSFVYFNFKEYMV